MRIALFFLSGLLVISGVACFGIFYHSGSVQALGGAMMFLCFGFAGFLIATFSEQILNALKSGSGSSRSA
jgi:hypothetical protein